MPAMKRGEIILYKVSEDVDFQIEVRIEDDTVWLTQTQMAELYNATKQNISLHINNVFIEGEVDPESTVKEYLTVQQEGARKVKRKLMFFNLDIIISVGYRVKSQRGVQFRRWANNILKEYLLQGHVFNHRFEKIEKKLIEHDQKFDFLIKSNLKPSEGIFYDGQIFDAWKFVSGLIRDARQSIILIDSYIDESVLALLSKRPAEVKAVIYTAPINRQLKHDLLRYNRQYPTVEIYTFTKSHDRFLIIDRNIVYHIGASLKDLGKKWFAFSRIQLDAKEMLKRLEFM